MININISIDNPPFEESFAKGITLAEGGDASKEATNLTFDMLFKIAGRGLEAAAEEQVKEAIQTATEQKKQDFKILIETAKEGGK